jgi:hypothetical protein
MEAMGVDRVIAVDLHCGQIQGFFGPRVPVDNLDGGVVAIDHFGGKDLYNPVIVSPDAGGVYRAKKFKEGLEHKYDLKEGVPGLALTFERQKFRFPRGDKFSVDATDLMASELGSIAYTDKGLQGVGEHDDTVMCLWIAECNVRYVSTGFKFTTA